MIKLMKRDRVLLIVAPTLYECFHAAKENGLDPPHIQGFRNVTRAVQLRGVRHGTPFIAINRSGWCASSEGFDLDRALEALQRQGVVRIAQEDDIRACRMYDSVPSREARA
nr:hypothetical protein REQ54_00820 [Rhizobium sp. Q54]